jgi:hypothetical protein
LYSSQARIVLRAFHWSLSASLFVENMAVVALPLLFALAGATELTPATWDAAVAGKSVFINFLPLGEAIAKI